MDARSRSVFKLECIELMAFHQGMSKVRGHQLIPRAHALFVRLILILTMIL